MTYAAKGLSLVQLTWTGRKGRPSTSGKAFSGRTLAKFVNSWPDLRPPSSSSLLLLLLDPPPPPCSSSSHSSSCRGGATARRLHAQRLNYRWKWPKLGARLVLERGPDKLEKEARLWLLRYCFYRFTARHRRRDSRAIFQTPRPSPPPSATITDEESTIPSLPYKQKTRWRIANRDCRLSGMPCQPKPSPPSVPPHPPPP
jgi:hypothetical protein